MADAQELDLGIVPDSTSCDPCCVSKQSQPDEKKPEYPSLCFRGKHADLFHENYGPCAQGDEYEVTVRLRTKAFSDGPCEYDKRIEFDVLSIIGDMVEEPSSEDTAEEQPARKPAQRKLPKKSSGESMPMKVSMMSDGSEY